MVGGLPLGAHVRGSSAWIVWQLLRAPLETRIAQLQRDPNVDPQVVRGLKQTASDLQSAAGQYRDWAAGRNAAGSAEVPTASVDAGLKGPLGWGTASMVAASLGCSTRWITQLKVEVYKKYLMRRLKLVARNGETLLVSETYYSKSNAERAAKRLRELL
jgi:uncharacterized protein YegP (UPF0339 family)